MIEVLALSIGIPATCLAAWAYTARLLYRSYRIHEAKKRACKHGACERCKKDSLWFQDSGYWRTAEPYTDKQLAAYAICHAFLWPIALPGYAMYTFVTANPPLAQVELEAKAKADEKRIRELEEQVGLRTRETAVDEQTVAAIAGFILSEIAMVMWWVALFRPHLYLAVSVLYVGTALFAVIAGDRVVVYISCFMAAVALWLWWNIGGGGPRFKRRLRRFADRYRVRTRPLAWRFQ